MISGISALLLPVPDLPTDSLPNGALLVLFEAIERAWPMVIALGAMIWYGGKFVKTVESIVADLTRHKEENVKQFKMQDEKIEGQGREISRIDASTDILLTHTGLKGA